MSFFSVNLNVRNFCAQTWRESQVLSIFSGARLVSGSILWRSARFNSIMSLSIDGWPKTTMKSLEISFCQYILNIRVPRNEWMTSLPSNVSSHSGTWMNKFAIKVVKIDSETIHVIN